MLNLRVFVVPGTEPWLPPKRDLRRLGRMLSRPARIEVWPRDRVAEAWALDHGGEPFPFERYAFRAWSRDGKATVLVDPTETRASVLWLMAHELAHLDLPASRLIRQAYRVPKSPGYFTSDVEHEAHPEEQLANRVATRTMLALGYPARSYDRPWWRQRAARYCAATSRAPASP